jgi:N-acetylneuraminate lyase
MKQKYNGIIPAFYACYDKHGEVDTEAVEALTDHLISKGVKGLYVGGSSGECIYQSVEERKLTLEHVMKASRGRVTVIAHVAANSTRDSMELARHAETMGVDAIAAIPPIYFKLPDYAISEYWNDISSAAPNTDFIIYNIPQLAGVALTKGCLSEMLKNPRVIGVKNSSMPTMDIQIFKSMGGENFVVFNGPDEQLVSGLAIGADGGIGGTYGVMPEVYIKIKALVDSGRVKEAAVIQDKANAIIYEMCSAHGNLYAVMKEIIKRREGLDLGGVRRPLANLIDSDEAVIVSAQHMIDELISSL